MRRETGRYRVTKVHEEQVRAFIPHPLPPAKPPLAIEGETFATGVRFAQTHDGAHAGESGWVPSAGAHDGSRGQDFAAIGTERVIPADIVITAFGFRASPEAWLGDERIAVNEQGRVRIDGGLDQQTSNPRVFAGGDNVRGADLVVTAVHDGREAGVAIARMLLADAP